MPLADSSRFRRAVVAVTLFILVLWLIELADSVLSLRLYRLGIYPRETGGLWGILSAPLIHGSWGHLISNSMALVVLGVVTLYGYPRAASRVLLFVYLGSGLGVWLFARHSTHIGASGLTHGLMFFVFVSGILRRDRLSIALSMIVFFLYGGMVWSIFPQKPEISYESHFFGALAGLLAAFLFRHCDPLPPVKTYEWEREGADAESALEDSDREGN
jgi:membrane associated rhomboid family serine protease